jgi:prepilin-type N-terminal cleavage/methylation domain-containing protein
MSRNLVFKSKSPFEPSSRGFTIIELLIATVVFSVVLLVFLAAFLQISRLFYKGVSMNNTQESARNVVQDISDDLKFSNNTPSTGPGYLCIGLHRYKYNLGYQLGSASGPGNYGILREDVSVACPAPSVPGSGSKPKEILDNGMQLNALSVNCNSAIGRCLINIHLVFYGGASDVFTSSEHPGNTTADHIAASKDPDALCTGDINSSQYCAVADYNSTVIQGL